MTTEYVVTTMSADVSDARMTLSLNISNVTDTSPEVVTGNGIDHHSATIVILVIYFVTAGTISLLGNMLVCVVIHRSKRLQSTTNYFVISLSITDIIYTVLIVPFQVTELVQNGWFISLAMCRIVRFLQYWLPGTVMFVLLCVCEDRYYTILYPLSFKITRGRAKHMITASWFASFIIACPALYFFGLDTINDIEYCASIVFSGETKVQGVFYITCYLSLTFAVSISIISIAYVKIFRYIWRTGIGGRTFQRTTNPVPRPKVKMVKMIMAVNMVIVALATPFVMTQLWFYSMPGGSTVATHNVFLAVSAIYFVCSVAKPGESSFGFEG